MQWLNFFFYDHFFWDPGVWLGNMHRDVLVCDILNAFLIITGMASGIFISDDHFVTDLNILTKSTNWCVSL